MTSTKRGSADWRTQPRSFVRDLRILSIVLMTSAMSSSRSSGRPLARCRLARFIGVEFRGIGGKWSMERRGCRRRSFRRGSSFWVEALLGRRGMEVLGTQSLARADNRGMASRSQDFANEEKIGQQGAEMAGRVQVVDELRADRRLG